MTVVKVLAKVFILLSFFCLIGCGNSYKHHKLANAASPYLKENADSPIDWHEWNDEALEKAKKENKPLLISIGYAACHWCHVMKNESFMDTAVARLMNENFICIKVDKEERPDIDNLYTNALQLLTGNSGWPLNAFALPNGKPFYAGTYYTKKSWISLLTEVAKAYKNKHDLVVKQAEALTKGIVNQDFLLSDTSSNSLKSSQAFNLKLYDSIYKRVDLVNGGFKGAPKFPTPTLAEFLLQQYYTTGNQQALKAVTTTVTNMALGGIYDHLEGGFARYTTDSAWQVPHFEKMLYDNGQMLSLYAHAYQVTKNEFYKKILDETSAFIDKNLAAKNGGYFSSANADSEAEEGKYYVWKEKDFLNAVAGDKIIADYFHVTAAGNWKHNENILYATQTPDEFATSKNIAKDVFAVKLATSKSNLLEVRNKRIKPSIDTKIITAWNSILLKGYADAYAATGNADYLEKAKKCAVFIATNMLSKDGSLTRIYINQNASISGFLDDYSWTANAFIRLYEVSFDKHWLSLAKQITDYAIIQFDTKQSALFYYSQKPVLNSALRKTDIADDYIPSSNAVMAKVLYSLGVMYDDTLYTNRSLNMLSAVKFRVNRMPSYHLTWALFANLIANKQYEIIITGKDAYTKNIELQKHYLPNSIFMGNVKADSLPLLQNKLIDSKTLIYICTDRICKRPVETVSGALEQMKK